MAIDKEKDCKLIKLLRTSMEKIGNGVIVGMILAGCIDAIFDSPIGNSLPVTAGVSASLAANDNKFLSKKYFLDIGNAALGYQAGYALMKAIKQYFM